MPVSDVPDAATAAADPAFRCGEGCVELGDIANEFSGDEDPMPGHLVVDRDVVDQPVCLAHTDRRRYAARVELAQQRVETAGVFRP